MPPAPVPRAAATSGELVCAGCGRLQGAGADNPGFERVGEQDDSALVNDRSGDAVGHAIVVPSRTNVFLSRAVLTVVTLASEDVGAATLYNLLPFIMAISYFLFEHQIGLTLSFPSISNIIVISTQNPPK
jgi:hypothetical protein